MRVNFDEIDYDEAGYYRLYKGKPFTGEVVQKLSDGDLLTLVNVRDGLEDGPAWYWHLNGTLEYEGQYQKGEPIGTHLRWHDNGILARTSTYDDQGDLVHRQEWDENGIPLVRRVEFGSIHLDRGNNAIHLFQGSPFNGEFTVTTEDRKVIAVESIRNGLKDGPFRTWYESGRIKSEGQHRKGMPTGVRLEWYENGQLAQETTYNENGQVVDIQRWKSEHADQY